MNSSTATILPIETTFSSLIEHYEVFCLDAFGVITNGISLIPGTASALDMLVAAKKEFYLVTNDASKLPHLIVERYAAKYGLPIQTRHVISAGMALEWFLTTNGFSGKTCCVIGTEHSKLFAQQGGVRIVSPEEDFEVFVLADEEDVTIRDLQIVFSQIAKKLSENVRIPILVPNTDRLIPPKNGIWTFGAGTYASLLESAFHALGMYVPNDLITYLGKPERHLFDIAKAKVSEHAKIIMIGDTLYTDILGANQAGIDSALVLTGNTSREALAGNAIQPKFVLDSLGER